MGTSELIKAANEVLKETKPLNGVAYELLSDLVKKNAKKKSSIKGML